MIRNAVEGDIEKCALSHRLGYETVGTIRAYKSDGIDEYLLVKRRP